MKIGKVPVASIVLLVLVATSLILNHIYPHQYGFDSPFMQGAAFAVIVFYILYYLNIFITAWSNNRKEKAEAQKKA